MDFDLLRAKGIVFGDKRAQFLPNAKGKLKIAMDEAIPMITNANSTVPEMFATYIDPEIIEIITAPRTATEVFKEAKLAAWTDKRTAFQLSENVGHSEAYSDFGKGTGVDVNTEFYQRDVYRFQAFMQCGDLEQETAALVKINLLSRKQQAATTVLSLDRNEMNLRGVSGKAIYGLLNDPNLPSALSPATVNGKTGWTQKGALGVYNDILTMFNSIAKATAGLVKFDTPMVLCIPPSVNSALLQVTDLGVAPALQLIQSYLKNVRVVLIPQLEDEGVAKALLIAEEVAGQKVAQFGVADVLRTSRVVQDYTSVSQKWMSSTTGAMIYRPMAFASMTGIQTTA